MASSAFSRMSARRPTLGLELENKGSVARDHLALERTFLAWLRTSLGLVSLGIAVAQLFKIPELVSTGEEEADAGLWFQDSAEGSGTGRKLEFLEKLGKPIGATCIALGALCLLLGSFRYFYVQQHLVRGVFPPSRIEVSAMALLVGALICAAFGVIVGTRVGASSA